MSTSSFLHGDAAPPARAGLEPTIIVAERNKHLGPRFDYARVSLRVETANDFEVVDRVRADSEARGFGFPDAFTRGVLEVIDASGNRPALRLVLESADHHPVDSSPQAFVEAGREAGRKLLKLAARR